VIDEGTGTPRVVRSVAEFVAGLSRWFAQHRQLQNVSISGEISGLREFNGHLAFTLKEGQSVLECVVWFDQRRALPALANGMAVIATGNVRVRVERSGYQLQVDAVELTGIGELYALQQRLKEKFAREGLFEANRKRAVPALPRRVVLISARGKAMEDFVATIRRQVPFVAVEFVETRVQGTGAEIDIAAAIDLASNRAPDAIVLTRGGGSYEDLFSFNLEPVVRAIVRANAPVLTAIGHSTDHHLADDVADMFFGTPSLAAEHIAKGWLLAIERLERLRRDLRRAALEALGRAAQRSDAAASALRQAGTALLRTREAMLASRMQRLDARSPQRVIAGWRERTATAIGRLDRSMNASLSARARGVASRTSALERLAAVVPLGLRNRCERAHAALDRLDPLAPLARGYAIVTHDGRALRDASTLSPQDRVNARLMHGTFSARVESVETDE
jgi:exodeoxyribonuclease VII large subunit